MGNAKILKQEWRNGYEYHHIKEWLKKDFQLELNYNYYYFYYEFYEYKLLIFTRGSYLSCELSRG